MPFLGRFPCGLRVYSGCELCGFVKVLYALFWGAAMFRDGPDHNTGVQQNAAGKMHVDDDGIVRQGELAL